MPTSMLLKAVKLALVLSPIALGIGSTLYWLQGDLGRAPEFVVAEVAGVLVGVIGLTLCNVTLRWFRWHFLSRRLGARLLTRESFRAYFASLPLLLTPFYCGEMLRGLFFARRDRRLIRVGVAIWAIERLGDAAALATWGLVCVGQTAWAALAAGATLIGSRVALAQVERSAPPDRHPGGHWASSATFCATTWAAWALPMLGLWLALRVVGVTVDPTEAGHVFVVSTATGGLTGIPGGIGVSGSVAIVLLESQVTASDAVPWAIALFRAGTIWFAVSLGVGLFLWWRRDLLRLVRGDAVGANHFDEIASAYGGEIPEHVKQRLLGRKTKLMVERLANRGLPSRLRGLDLGCGQGWYATAMAREGFAIAGVDMSAGQVAKARAYAQAAGVELDCSVASAAEIPFEDESFDFVYSINVVHHILSEADRQSTYAEIRRVLKPGGMFFLHEMNTINPVFRLYMSYVFPLINSIDEGNERWVLPNALPQVSGAHWASDVDYFTFIPDFVPAWLLRWLAPVERVLEELPFSRRQSAHFMACLVRDEPIVRERSATYAADGNN
ncbi:MAG: methyltransferase domain-containing protein [Myxococcales bacterium FL481]|nr:MAG: methyltransferase domain-containing protein [Myxococcales bacterium FL481]